MMIFLNKVTRIFILIFFIFTLPNASFANPLFSEMGQDERSYSANTPLVRVDSIKRSLAFYEGVFGFLVHNIMKDDGKIFHAELTLDKTVILMIGPDNPTDRYGHPPANTGQKPSFNFFVFVDDVDALAKRIKAYKGGQHVVYEPRDEFWGDRTAMFTDLDGYLWIFATRISPE